MPILLAGTFAGALNQLLAARRPPLNAVVSDEHNLDLQRFQVEFAALLRSATRDP